MFDSGGKASGRAVVMENGSGIVVTGTVHGDVIQAPQGEFRLTPLQRPWRTRPRADNPTTLLTWRSRIPKQLHGREREIQSLLDWAQEPHPLGVRLIHGGAGVGKTRLAFELAERLAETPGWFGGQIARPGELGAYPLGDSGTLLIIDYPDEKQDAVRAFFDCLANTEEPDGSRLRILLLARRKSASGLYQRIAGDNAPPIALAALTLKQDEAAWTPMPCVC